MLGFNQDEYLTSAREIIAARKKTEQVADDIHQSGFSSLFFASVGGSLAPMMAINEFAKELTDLPVYIEQAAELIHKGNKRLNKDSVVVTLSKSGDTKESVAIAEWCKAQGIRVVAITKNADSPLAQAATWHIPMRHKNGVEYEYMLLYWLFFRVLSHHGDFADYERFASQLETLPEHLLQAKQIFDPQADQIASRYHRSDYMMWVGGAEMWGEVYLFSMCILEEMQWKRTRPVTSAEFFHGALELLEKDVPLLLVKGEGKCRALDERVERFAAQITDNLVVIDPAHYPMPGIDDAFRWIMAPCLVSTLLVDRLAAHFEHYTGHSLDIRRYYRQFEY
ncbi:SIS domain-containing protein [Citrobacter werkmanii]|uniref:SIS domain-containing protein n=1 Tax=Citrobacter TaxID=544 RepID=UPI00084692BA|nr:MULTISPECIES: SIS domain-containing protein [Citrobacter]MBQ4922667.1 SIS domain-containing protein [Citrobacter werkmanii]MBQ4935955.1 SIS domain-containing protein [Citrobacter werkmanii]MBQ4948059.1 SIS domain-containing protein [Citrobacter werkmanii]MBQ4964453.1 SIS domain-containing protein [Citrobacter werkmanii]MDM3294924.1 SIS domain-containing protein [Citrobacter sp. Cc139]